MEYYQLWVWRKSDREPAVTVFPTNRLAFQAGRKFIRSENAAEFQVFKISRTCLGGEQIGEVEHG